LWQYEKLAYFASLSLIIVALMILCPVYSETAEEWDSIGMDYFTNNRYDDAINAINEISILFNLVCNSNTTQA
jgi:hypothetical protein